MKQQGCMVQDMDGANDANDDACHKSMAYAHHDACCAASIVGWMVVRMAVMMQVVQG
jgi:hypothetical protein